MVFADVVSLLARTNRMRVVAYAAPTGTARHEYPRRASEVINPSASTAIPDRKLATCQPVSDVALIAAPPVENRSAAARRRSGAEIRTSMIFSGTSYYLLYLTVSTSRRAAVGPLADPVQW